MLNLQHTISSSIYYTYAKGAWEFDAGDEDIDEKTRLIRCKDCRGAFHLECMLGKKNNEEKGEGGGSDDDEEENVENDSDRKMPAINHGDGVAADIIEQTRDPKRCYKCVEHKQQPGQVVVDIAGYIQQQQAGQSKSNTRTSAGGLRQRKDDDSYNFWTI